MKLSSPAPTIAVSLAVPCACLLAALLSAPAQAATPPALGTTAAYGYTNPAASANLLVQNAGTIDAVFGNGSFHASADYGAATVQSSMAVGSVAGSSTDASASLTFDFAIQVGGAFFSSVPDPVPFIVLGMANLSATGAAEASGYLRVARSPADTGSISPSPLVTTTQSVFCSSSSGVCGLQSVSVSGLITPYYTGSPGIGQIGRVSLLSSVRVTTQSILNNGGFVPSQASTLVDPMITIDPSFLASHPGLTYNVIINPAINAVPEPASAVLLLGGMLGLGMGLGWRSRSSRQR
jgi:hypothetical protein